MCWAVVVRRSQAQKVGRKSETVYSEIPSEGKTNGSDLFSFGFGFFLIYSIRGVFCLEGRGTLSLFLGQHGSLVGTEEEKKIPVA